MKIVIFTANALRHKFVANQLSGSASQTLVVSECSPQSPSTVNPESNPLIERHFQLRDEAEQKFFGDQDWFNSACLPITYRQVNNQPVYEAVRRFAPDAAFVYGASIIAPQLIGLIPAGRFINMHLGLSPYYRGAGTNFWPFVNSELEYVGATILHLDAGIDTGDIISHVRPTLEIGDTVHTAGCKVIQAGVAELKRVLAILQAGKALPRVKQWETEVRRYYKKNDFTESSLAMYKRNLENGLIENYLKNPPKQIKLVSL